MPGGGPPADATSGVARDGPMAGKPDEDKTDELAHPLTPIWHMFEAGAPGVTAIRIPALLQALAEDDSSLRSYLDAKFGETVSVDKK